MKKWAKFLEGIKPAPNASSPKRPHVALGKVHFKNWLKTKSAPCDYSKA